MPKELIFDGETLINATDWKAKSGIGISRLGDLCGSLKTMINSLPFFLPIKKESSTRPLPKLDDLAHSLSLYC